MKKNLIFVAFITAAVVSLTVLKSSSNGAPGSYTNSPVSQGNCSACHGGGNFNSNQGIELDGLPANGYDIGETYQLTLRLTSSTNSNGFQLSCLDSDNNNGGEFTPGGDSRGSGFQGSEMSLTHNSPNASGEWTFDWTAPQGNAGTLTFYAVGNATQGAGTNPGDMIYGQTFTLEPSQTTYVEKHKLTAFQLYPNPVEREFYIDHAYDGEIPFSVFNTAGKQVKQGVLNRSRTAVQAEDLLPGIYFVRISGKVSKFVKL